MKGSSSGYVGTALHFDTSSQPLYHKNFDLLETALAQFRADGYALYILADSPKQNERLRSIFEETGKGTVFEPVEHTLHEGFIDHTLRMCWPTVLLPPLRAKQRWTA